jgi:hypothetical protein
VEIDDPRLVKAREKMFERAKKMDALTLAVLRSHLLAEQCMNEFIAAKGVKRKWLGRATFADKVKKCKLIAKTERDDPLWEVLYGANQLRNTIAHSLSSERIAEKMKQLRERYYAALTPEQAAGLADQSDDYVAQSACLTCGGYIATLKSRVDEEKAKAAG